MLVVVVVEQAGSVVGLVSAAAAAVVEVVVEVAVEDMTEVCSADTAAQILEYQDRKKMGQDIVKDMDFALAAVESVLVEPVDLVLYFGQGPVAVQLLLPHYYSELVEVIFQRFPV